MSLRSKKAYFLKIVTYNAMHDVNMRDKISEVCSNSGVLALHKVLFTNDILSFLIITRSNWHFLGFLGPLVRKHNTLKVCSPRLPPDQLYTLPLDHLTI